MTTPIPAMQAAALEARVDALMELADKAIQAYAAWLAEFIAGDLPSLNTDRLNAEKDAAREKLRLSLLRAALETPSEAERVCFEAYQVVGCLLSDAGLFDTPQAGKILDNLSQAKMVHSDVLPWPSVEGAALDAGEPQPVATDAVWLIQYDDYDRRPEIVVGEAAARARFSRISDSWNAHLFVKVESNSRDTSYYDANIRLAASPVAAAPTPEFDRDDDSELLIDWSPKPGRMLTLSLRADGRLSYAFHWDAEKAHGTAQMPAPLSVKWTGADGESHEITLDYAARIAKWVFDTYGDVPQVDAAMDAAPQGDAITVPQGWKLVPLEPTPEMTAAAAATPGIQAIDGASQVHQARGYPLPASAFLDGSPLEQAWRAMLAASPTLNEQGKPHDPSR